MTKVDLEEQLQEQLRVELLKKERLWKWNNMRRNKLLKNSSNDKSNSNKLKPSGNKNDKPTNSRAI